MRLQWLAEQLSGADTVVAADVTYVDPPVARILACTIKALLQQRHPQEELGLSATEQQLRKPDPICWAAANDRNPATWAAFCGEFRRWEARPTASAEEDAAIDLSEAAGESTSNPPQVDYHGWLCEVACVLSGEDPNEIWLEEVDGAGAEDAWEAFGRLRLVRVGTGRALRHAQRQTAASDGRAGAGAAVNEL